jgi:hypothetical protein
MLNWYDFASIYLDGLGANPRRAFEARKIYINAFLRGFV